MSLINDALKKAQKQRTGESPLAAMPAIGGESAERIARRAKPSGAPPFMLWIGLSVAVLAVGLIAGIMLMGRKPDAPQTTAAAAAPVVKPVVPEPTPVAPPTPAPSPIVVSTNPPSIVVASPPRSEPLATKIELPKPAPVAAPVGLEPVAVVPAKPTAPGKLEPRAINFIESLRVAGIRASATDSKVLMNDRVYRIGSVVEAELGLKLTGITSGSLTFEDDNGGSYTRTF